MNKTSHNSRIQSILLAVSLPPEGKVYRLQQYVNWRIEQRREARSPLVRPDAFGDTFVIGLLGPYHYNRFELALCHIFSGKDGGGVSDGALCRFSQFLFYLFLKDVKVTEQPLTEESHPPPPQQVILSSENPFMPAYN